VHRYVLRRLAVALPALLIASFIVFALPRLIPGDAVQLMLEEKGYGTDLEDLREKLGLNRPIPVQYAEWLGRVVRADLGESLWTGRPVVAELVRRLPVSLELGCMALAFSVLIALPVGILAAIRQDTAVDLVARSAAILGLSIPGYWVATLVIVLPAVWWGWAPPVRFIPFRDDPLGHIAQFALPAAILGIASAAALTRLTRTALLEVLRQDYVRTAWAKGLAERAVVLRHSLKNAVIPVMTILGIQLAQIFGGTVIFETIFGLPGMGRFLFEAITQRDYPVIQGINLLIASIVIALNLLVDILYAVVDPRLRLS
jgi:peptide/nickel transport system permease protein